MISGHTAGLFRHSWISGQECLLNGLFLLHDAYALTPMDILRRGLDGASLARMKINTLQEQHSSTIEESST